MVFPFFLSSWEAPIEAAGHTCWDCGDRSSSTSLLNETPPSFGIPFSWQMLVTKPARVGMQLKQTILHLETGLLSPELIFPHQISCRQCNGRSGEWMNGLPFRVPYDFSLFVLHCLNLWAKALVFRCLLLAGSAGCDPWGQRYCWTRAIASGTVKRAMCSCAGPRAWGPLTHTMLSHCLSFHMSVILSSPKPTWTHSSEEDAGGKVLPLPVLASMFPIF